MGSNLKTPPPIVEVHMSSIWLRPLEKREKNKKHSSHKFLAKPTRENEKTYLRFSKMDVYVFHWPTAKPPTRLPPERAAWPMGASCFTTLSAAEATDLDAIGSRPSDRVDVSEALPTKRGPRIGSHSASFAPETFLGPDLRGWNKLVPDLFSQDVSFSGETLPQKRNGQRAPSWGT